MGKGLKQKAARRPTRLSLKPGLLLLFLLICTLAAAGRDLRREGIEALNAGRKLAALTLFERYRDDNPASAEAHFLIGRALMELERPESALASWRRTLELDSLYLPARQHMVLAYERLGRFDQATACLDGLLRRHGTSRGDSLSRALESRRKLNLQRLQIQNSSAGNPEALRFGDHINSEWDEYMPFIQVDERLLGFSSNRPGGLDRKGRAQLYKEDFWFSERVGGFSADGWTPARPAGEPLNTEDSEGAGSLSADGRLLVFSACGREDSFGDCDLYLSRLVDGNWQPATHLGRAVNGPWWDSHPAISADGGLLIFSSNRPGGVGGCDLWLSRRGESGEFLPAENLGDVVNSVGDEQGPFLHADGQSLYFSSAGHAGLGGMDLFLSRMEEGSWSVPVNLGSPINTPQADLRMVIPGRGERAIFASRREGRPSLDLYFTEMPACCPPQVTYLLSGFVNSAATGQPLAATLRLEALRGRSPSWELALCHEDGYFALPLPAGEFLLFVTHPDHVFASWILRSGEDVPDSEPVWKRWSVGAAADTMRIWLSPLVAGAHVTIDNLEFDLDSDHIRPDGLPVLRQVLNMLEGSPGMCIELRGHTDDQGTEAYNQDLSLRRAAAVRTWLIAQGTDSIRIEASGFGMDQPVAPGKDRNSRARNRRTEFLVSRF